MVIKLLLLVAITWVSFVSSRQILRGDKGGYCEIEGMLIKEGEAAPHPNLCMQYDCLHGFYNHVGAKGCPEFVPRPGCGKSEENNRKRYPECCPVEVC